jgi:trigger factor
MECSIFYCTQEISIIMKSEVERLGNCKVALEVEVPVDGVTKEREKVYEELERRTAMKGFRKGKVPRKILEARFSNGVEREVLERLISGAYSQAVSRAGIIPCCEPKIEGIEFLPDQPLSFKAVVEIKPKVNLGKYKGIKVAKKVGRVKDRDVAKTLERLRHRHAEFVTIEDRPARSGDYVIVDFEGMVEGKPLKGGKASNYSLEIGSNILIHGFEDQLIGMDRGDQREIRVTFPKEHPDKGLAGKEACFKVVLKEIKRKKLPAIDDEFAKDLGGFKGLAEVKEKISQDLKRLAENKAQKDWENRIVDKLIENTPLEVPQTMVAREIDNLIAGLKYQGLTPERLNMTGQKLREKYRVLATRNVKSFLILEQIAQEENIQATNEDIARRITQIARYTNRASQSIEKDITRSGRMDALRQQVKQAKALKSVLDHAVK